MLKLINTNGERDNFYRTRIHNNLVKACRAWISISRQDLDLFNIPAYKTPTVLKPLSKCKNGRFIILKSDKYDQVGWRLAKVIQKDRGLNTTLVEYLLPTASSPDGSYPHDEPAEFWIQPWIVATDCSDHIDRTELVIGNFDLSRDNTIPMSQIRLARRHFPSTTQTDTE